MQLGFICDIWSCDSTQAQCKFQILLFIYDTLILYLASNLPTVQQILHVLNKYMK